MDLVYVTGIPVVTRISARADERRRSLRYRCSGMAEVLRIPRIGLSVQATVLNISLHGCLVLTDTSFESGTPLEVLLQVKAISFRASGTVKVLRGPSAVGIEFTRISDGAQRRLSELLADLERFVSMPTRKVRSAPILECRPQSVATPPLPTTLIHNMEQTEPRLLAPSGDLAAPQAPGLPSQRLLLRRAPEVDVFG